MNFLYGFIWSLCIAFLAYYKKSLTLSGMLAAILMGTLIYGFGTYITFILLMAFFISSSIFTKFKAEKKDGGRTVIQVISNALATLIFSICYYMTHDQIYLVISAIAIAATTADTWASELGKLSRGKTFSILTFRRVEKGSSGGVSLWGFVASLLGASLIAGLFLLLLKGYGNDKIPYVIYGVTIVIAGFLGSLIDSYLGILVQAKYFDQNSGHIIENFVKNKGLKLVSGIKYVNNDMVNLLMTLITTAAFTLVMI